MDYWFSEKGAAAYKAIEKEYPKHPFDTAYDTFKRKTRNSTQNEFIINKMIRLQIPTEEDATEEFILYDLKEIRNDGLGNPQSYVRTNLGKYPIPQKITKIVYDEDHQPIPKVVGIGDINVGYEFPFTKEKADELHKWCNDKFTVKNTKKTEYLVQKLGEMKISVDSFNSWKNGEFETLYATGNMEGIEKTVVRPKTKKSKEHEQAELQREILRKPYTTTTVTKTKDKEEVITETT